jgi:multiple sugar transport system permease protein
MRSKFKGFLLLTPVLSLVALVTILPIVNMIYNSLLKTQFGFGKGEFIGLSNYVKLFNDEVFVGAVGKSFIWTLENLLFQLTIPLLIALLLNRQTKFYRVTKSLILIPWVLPMVVISIVWRWLLEPNIGFVNHLITNMGFEPVNFMGSLNLTFHVLVLINSWHFIPFGTILMLAALSTVPQSLYDAAKVDGAGSFKQFIYITFPLIGKIIWFVGLLAFMWSFNTFDLIWLTTQGGPSNATMTLPTYIYKLAFKMYDAGRSSAAAFISTLILIGVGVIYFTLLSPKSDTEVKQP